MLNWYFFWLLLLYKLFAVNVGQLHKAGIMPSGASVHMWSLFLWLITSRRWWNTFSWRLCRATLNIMNPLDCRVRDAHLSAHLWHLAAIASDPSHADGSSCCNPWGMHPIKSHLDVRIQHLSPLTHWHHSLWTPAYTGEGHWAPNLHWSKKNGVKTGSLLSTIV